jgi:hypothetical protein
MRNRLRIADVEGDRHASTVSAGPADPRKPISIANGAVAPQESVDM